MPYSPSPLPYLLAEDRHGDRQAREALFCTFNADLGYFERVVLGVTRSAGARVTVIADGRISAPDPRATRNAGTRYVHGLAVTGSSGSFHPKVSVIAGPQRAVVAVGSGNLSPGGWHLNKELWTIAEAGLDRCPAIVADVAGWLRTLGQVCVITPAAMLGVERTAACLEQLAAAAPAAEHGHRLVHTSSAALIDQLPAGEVARLALYAPFHDEKATALRRLIERLRPGRVTLAVQSGGRTIIAPDAVREVSGDLGVPVEIVEDAEGSYRHGKLIEATGPDGSRWTLTGSPNLTARALLRPAAEGGNIEAAVISRPGTSLFPAGRPIALSDVPAVRVAGSARLAGSVSADNAGVILLGAARTGRGVEVILSGASAMASRLLAGGSGLGGTGQWKDVGAVPAGAASHVLAGVDLPGGTPVRCGAGGIVFVTDPALVLIRPGEVAEPGRADPAGPAALIGDPMLLERWLRALGGETGVVADGEDWLAYADDAKARLGAAMFHFALGGFPGMNAVGAGLLELLEPTDAAIGDNRPGLDSDDEMITGDDTDPGGSVAVSDDEAGSDVGSRAERSLTEAERRRSRRNLETALREVAPSLPAIHRLAVLTLVLCGVQAGLWDSPLGDQGWLRAVSEALKNLDLDDIPPQLSSSAAAWAAVATYLMHEHRPTTGRPSEVLLYEQAAAQVSHLFPDADPQAVTDFATPFTNRNGYPVDPGAVMELIGMVVQDDPLAEAIEILGSKRPAWDVHKHNDTMIHARGDFQATFLPAAEILDAIPAALVPAAAWATGSKAGWTFAIRDADTLIRIDKSPQGQVTWWHYRLSSLTSPTGIARDPEVANRARIRHGPLNQPFPSAIEAMTAAGINPTIDPPSPCPPE